MSACSVSWISVRYAVTILIHSYFEFMAAAVERTVKIYWSASTSYHLSCHVWRSDYACKLLLAQMPHTSRIHRTYDLKILSSTGAAWTIEIERIPN